MIKKSIVILLVFMSLGSLTAQTFNHKLVPVSPQFPKKISSSDTLKILAVMVEFQPDKDGATFGNGTFGTIYSSDYGNSILDPLPHNQTYFEEHLQFVKNYFKQVSNGMLNIAYTVMPKIITVNQRMRNYSPPINSEDFSSLAGFSKEVWTKADSANPGFDFKDYNLFIIFHAGVGRDLSLPGSINDSKDLPSVFLSYKSLEKIYGSGFSGFQVSNNSYQIKNTLIMPETESREQESYGGTVLYQVTINGLLAASVGSYLGLPDLFDTQTGLSAIGRFGLEDGQSIFAYNGAFPPEPSAWEKIYLGWASPVTLSPGNYSVNIAASLAATAADTVILKLPINSSEYFLVENRERDVHNDGAKITYALDGESYTETFTKDQPGFYSIETDSLKGVITNVDEFDWALPGVIDDTADYKGGILIWHIDDNVIDSTIANDRVNAVKTHRGVNLMEASGVPIIGEKFTDILGDVIIGEGSYQDYWFKNNDAQLYKNRFASDTRPSSNSNLGANSLITLSGFSDSGNKMSFKITYGDSLIKPVFSKNLSIASGRAHLNLIPDNGGNLFGIVVDKKLDIVDNNGNISAAINNFSNFKTASYNYNNNYFVIGAIDSSVNVYSDGLTNKEASVNAGFKITAPPVIFQRSGQQPVVLIGTGNGKIEAYSIVNGTLNIVSSLSMNNLNCNVIKISTDNDYYSFVGTPQQVQYVVGDNENNSYTGSGTVLDFATTVDNAGNYVNIVLLEGNKFDIIIKGKLVREFTIDASSNINSFSLADLKQDGNNYIIFNDSLRVDAVNLQGAEASNFPFYDPLSLGFKGTPLAADFAGDSKSEIITATNDGRIFAIDGGSGKQVTGFPLSSGVELNSIPALLTVDSKISLAVLNSDNNFTEWKIGAGEGTIYWAEENGNNGSASFVKAASQQNISNKFFPSDRVYNYPNPVYGNKTYIHYYVAQDSKINIKIFDIAGDFVAELNDVAQGGMEKETAWNVSGIQSGIYLARVEAQDNSGKTETNIIKIAVVK